MAELTDFDALRAFRSLTDELKAEQLFIGQLSLLREMQRVGNRLDTLSSAATKTADVLDTHLLEHSKDDMQAAAFFGVGVVAWRVIVGVVLLMGGIGSAAAVIGLFQ